MANTIIISNAAQKLYNESIICDMVFGFDPEIEVPQKWEALLENKKSKFAYTGLSVGGEYTSLETQVRYLARTKAHILNNPENFILVNHADDILRAKKENKLAVSFMLQGSSSPIAYDLNMVDLYYQMGLRSLLLCYNVKNNVGDGCAERTDGGISNFGLQLIEKMNQVGMLIDCSHAGYKTSLEVMEYSKDLVIFSHSDVHAIHPHVRNLKDEQIIACAKSAGVIGMNSMAVIMGDENASSEKMVDHINYIADLVGNTDAIALGLDQVYFTEIMPLFFERMGQSTYPKNYIPTDFDPYKCFKPTQLIEVVELLIRSGYSETNIKGILGENFLRVARRVWK